MFPQVCPYFEMPVTNLSYPICIRNCCAFLLNWSLSREEIFIPCSLRSYLSHATQPLWLSYGVGLFYFFSSFYLISCVLTFKLAPRRQHLVHLSSQITSLINVAYSIHHRHHHHRQCGWDFVLFVPSVACPLPSSLASFRLNTWGCTLSQLLAYCSSSTGLSKVLEPTACTVTDWNSTRILH